MTLIKLTKKEKCHDLEWVNREYNGKYSNRKNNNYEYGYGYFREYVCIFYSNIRTSKLSISANTKDVIQHLLDL